MAFVTVESAFWKFIRCCGERRNVEAIVEVNKKRKEEREKKREENSERVTVLAGGWKRQVDQKGVYLADTRGEKQRWLRGNREQEEKKEAHKEEYSGRRRQRREKSQKC